MTTRITDRQKEAIEKLIANMVEDVDQWEDWEEAADMMGLETYDITVLFTIFDQGWDATPPPPQKDET